ncbi:histidine phosphatase family protein [Sulfitobacter sp. MF3-043]|uniref:histidine phosphatase family protein n=1 Tax=Sulfitobacter sediminivivens TaxID=3252902 RepID=UPI0036DC1B32
MFKLIGVGLLLAAGTSASAEEMQQSDLFTALKGGGYVIYLRHASTESDYADQVTAVPNDCATQRVLSESGWQQARVIGKAIKDLAIPVSEVFSSEYCRAWQTADLAFGSYEKKAALNFEPAEEYSAEQTAKMRTNVMPFLTAPTLAQGNRVIVGHDDPFEAATGIYPEPQGVAYVLKSDGKGGVEVLGHIDPDAWPAS